MVLIKSDRDQMSKIRSEACVFLHPLKEFNSRLYVHSYTHVLLSYRLGTRREGVNRLDFRLSVETSESFGSWLVPFFGSGFARRSCFDSDVKVYFEKGITLRFFVMEIFGRSIRLS